MIMKTYQRNRKEKQVDLRIKTTSQQAIIMII